MLPARHNTIPTRPSTDGSTHHVVDAVLKVLRGQRDDKQLQRLEDTFDFNPQIFQTGVHYIVGPIKFKNPYRRTPSITYGAASQKIIQDITAADEPNATGYTPLVIYPYTYGYTQSAGYVDGFYIGLYAMTAVPASVTNYTISWHASGRGSSYPQQRIDEAWSSAYNPNEAAHLVNTTGQTDTQ